MYHVIKHLKNEKYVHIYEGELIFIRFIYIYSIL